MVRPGLALLGVLLATTAAAAGAAEPRAAAVRAYERGARELEFGRFAEAATAFAAAIALDAVENPQPVARPSGMNFEPYLPHLALGVARCESGDLPAAATSWAESDRQAVASAARGGARLLSRRAECAARNRDGLSALGRAATPPAPEAVGPEPAPMSPVGVRLQDEGAPAAPVRAVGEAAAPEPTSPPAGPAASAAATEGAVAPLPPPELLRAAQELFDGRPAMAYETLRGWSSERSRARGQAHLLRAAACFDMARLDPDSAPEWLARARAERAAARRATSNLVPDRRYFAPAFVEFFADGADPKPPPDLLAR